MRQTGNVWRVPCTGQRGKKQLGRWTTTDTSRVDRARVGRAAGWNLRGRDRCFACNALARVFGCRGRFPLRAASSTLFPLTSRVATRSNPKRPSNEHYRGTQSGSPVGPSVLLFTRMQPKTSTRTATGPKRHTTVPQLASQRFAFCV